MIIGLGLTLRSTLLGSTAVSDPYEVAGFSPPLVFDFAEEFYRTGGSTTTFDSAMTHSRSGNATMVDSDGVLKWAPHNLMTYSEDLSNAAWVKTSYGAGSLPVVTDNGDFFTVALDSGGSLIGDQSQISSATFTSGGAGIQFTAIARVRASGPSDIGKQIALRHVGASSYGVVTLTADWQDATRHETSFASTNYSLSIGLRGTITTDQVVSFDIEFAALYRSDLGGMVDNPDTGNSYVPTTSAARYLPRRGHHIYNGSAWANEGVLVESEARTNLLLNSGTLATQNVTVTAVPHTLHFTGTGTVVLSGTHIGTLVGTGTGENNRVSLTFTPTAGTLTVTVTGTVTNADLEVGSTLSSHKPTSGSTVTRSADTIIVPYANLPWPTPNVIGEELVTNGTFDTGTSGWTSSAYSLALLSNALEVSFNGVTFGSFEGATASMVAGKVYQMTYEVVDASQASNFRLNAAHGNAPLNKATGTHTVTWRQVSTTTSISFYVDGIITGESIDIDNISVREIDPLSVSIQMDGKMTYADDGTAASVVLYRWYLDANNRLGGDISGSAGGTGALSLYQVASGVVDTVLGTVSEFTPGVNVPFNIASRHGSTFINGAVSGTALTANTTPTALPDLSATNLQLGYDYMGTIKTLRMWANDLGDDGLEEATA